MVISQDVEVILIGLAIGFVSSVLGAMLQYWYYHRFGKTRQENFPGIIFLVSGLLGLIGLSIIIISFFTGWTKYAIYTGVGVVTGFFLGFIVMVMLWSFFSPKLKK